MSFSAPIAKTNEELANVLLDIASGLKATSKTVVAECDGCFKFILEGEGYMILEEETLCTKCLDKG